MKKIGFIIQKEFRQIFRNKGMLPIIFLMPVIQLLILANAATFEVKNITFSYIDQDQSSLSRSLIRSFEHSKEFDIVASFSSQKQAIPQMLTGKVSVIMEIPRNFERDLVKEKKAFVGLTIDAIDGAAAGVKNVYINQIIKKFNKQIQIERVNTNVLSINRQNILIIPSFWYNKTLNYKTFMVPGILVLLVTMITLFLSGMNIVREKELGTLEQINVTPLKKYEFIIGKLFPFWIIGLILLSVGLIIAKIVFDVPIVGSIGIMYIYTAIYILLVLGIGLFISNFTDTQQQAMFISWFFMVIFILMSGLFTPIESMPKWAQYFTEFNPVRYFVEVMRMVMLKGAGLSEITGQILKTIAFALVMNGLAIWSYKKTN